MFRKTGKKKVCFRIPQYAKDFGLWNNNEKLSYETENGIGKGYWGCGHQACIRDFYRCLEEGRRYQGDVEGVEITFDTMMRIYEAGR